MYKICFYVPASHLSEVKESLFKAGAGRIGNYAACAWQTLGEGQFKPLADSQPYLGQAGELQIEAEYKVELVCEANCLSSAIKALIATHPYEEPAYQYWEVNTCKVLET